MNKQIINEIAVNLSINVFQVEKTLKLLEEGNTIPFIARYRKELTGNLKEEKIKEINEVYQYQVNLLKRKEDVIRLIDEKELLNDELKNKIMNCSKLIEVEDLYRPYKEKKKTKATEAIKNGLEPLAKIILSFPKEIYNIEKFLNENVKTKEDALIGAKYIIAEYISDNASYRKYIRNNIFNNGKLTSKLKKNANDEKGIYEMYYNYSESIKHIKPHRVLAVNRGEKDGILSVSIDVIKDYIFTYLEKRLVKDENSICSKYVKDAIEDSYKRLIFPSIEREIRSEITEIAEKKAIDVFSKNLEKYLLTPPMKDKIILGLDPAFRTGCKLAVIDYTGKMLDISVIYPHEPHNKIQESKKIFLDLIEKYDVDIVAIGNGTASRESEKFVSDAIKSSKKQIKYIIVNEAGASVYSASDLAIKEFPDLTVEKRSAISIARRLQDPLSELVKIDPKSIGVGQYQHDVKQKNLNEALDFVVSKSVNNVGVNINTASSSILKYVSGLNKKSITNIIDYRDKYGKFNSREELENKKILSAKTYEQAIGFLRIVDGCNPFDKTSIHPESYKQTEIFLKELGLTPKDIGSKELIDKLSSLDLEIFSKKYNIDLYTLEDIINSLKKPNRDPRDDFEKPILRNDILKLEDLKVGMELEGTVRNVVDFGVFVDIGLHNDGLIHISKITDKYIKHPSEILNVGDIVRCYVDEIFVDKEKVSLTMKKN